MRIRPVRPDDYEPWLAGMIRRGEVEPPDELVIEDEPSAAAPREQERAHNQTGEGSGG